MIAPGVVDEDMPETGETLTTEKSIALFEKFGIDKFANVKVADLSEFWRNQKNIVICDPNLIACEEWKDLLQQLIDN